MTKFTVYTPTESATYGVEEVMAAIYAKYQGCCIWNGAEGAYLTESGKHFVTRLLCSDRILSIYPTHRHAKEMVGEKARVRREIIA